MTSLADEMLASSKPVIIFEPDDFPSCFLDYGSDIIAKDLEDLDIKVKKIKSDLNFYNNKINPIRERFYKKFNRENFFAELEKLNHNL